MRSWSISVKLLGLMLVGGVGALAAIAWVSVSTGSRTVLERETAALETVRTSRSKYIETYFRIIRGQIINFAADDMIVAAIEDFTAAFADVTAQSGRAADAGSPAAAELERYYEEQLRPRLEAAGLAWKGADHYLPAAPEAILLQAMYIAENDMPVGRKHELDAAPEACDYNRLHRHYHSLVRDFRESFGYYDIFLLDLHGNLLYSVFKEADFATNFVTGPYRDTNFAEVYRRARSAPPKTAIIVDFAPYEPSYGAPASFIGSPVFRGGERIGVAVFQTPVEEIDGIVGDAAGLGETGEAYLIGADGLMRSKSRFDDESSVFVRRIETPAARAATAGGEGTSRQVGNRGREVLASFGPLKIEGLQWAMLAEIDMAEVMAPAVAARNRIILLVALIGAIVATLSAWMLQRVVIGPVRGLVGAARRVEDGDYTTRFEAPAADEIGKLASAFNHMTESIERDIAERQRTAEELQQAHAAAKEASRAKGEFLSNMSHELRTPLNGVLGYAQILKRDRGLTSRQRESLESIESCGQHLLTLINDVLDLSKIEAGRMDVKRAPCDLHRLLKSVNDIVAHRAEHKGLGFRISVGPEVPRHIVTDPVKLKQVLVNLLGNAIKFTERGEVGLRVREADGQRLEFEVHDSGIGMTAEELREIFDPFRQAEGGRMSGGTGLGLAISRRLIEALGGAIVVSSTPGKGSRFTVTHPLEEGDEGAVEAVEETLAGGGDRRLAPGQEVEVLVVDDRDTNRDVLTRLLEDAGFRTSVAGNGAEGLARLRERHPPIVLMDVRMPVMNGIEATREIREDADLRKTVVIAVTASVFPEFKEEALAAGFDDFIAKPFRAAEILTKIEHHLGVRFVEEAPQDVRAAPAEYAFEDAAGVGRRLHEALRYQNMSTLKSLGAELAGRTDGAAPIGRRISELARAVDFEALRRLADGLIAAQASQDRASQGTS